MAARSASEYVFGLVHGAYALPSTRHWNSRSAAAVWSSVPVNSTISEPVVTFVISASGSTTSSTVQVWLSVRALPAASVAFTSNVCWAADRPEYDFGEEQAAYAAPSRRHSVVTAPLQLSLVLKANWAVMADVVAAGFSLSVMLGAVRSATVQLLRTV